MAIKHPQALRKSAEAIKLPGICNKRRIFSELMTFLFHKSNSQLCIFPSIINLLKRMFKEDRKWFSTNLLCTYVKIMNEV